MLKEIIIHVHSVKETIASYHVKPHATKSVHIQAHTDVKYEFIEKSSGYAPENIATKRVGKDLHIAFEGNDINDPDLIIDDYYDHMGEVLTGKAEDGLYYDYVPESAQTSDAVSGLHDGAFAGQALGGDGFMTPLWIEAGSFGLGTLGIVAGIGGIAAAAGGGGGGSTNHAPILAETDVTGEVTEDDTVTAYLTDTGTIAFTDVDSSDTHTVSVTHVDTLGILTAVVSDSADTVTWNYTVPNIDVQYLAEGEEKIETFNVTLSDGHGGTDVQTVTITLTGTNDQPVIDSITTTGGLTEVAGTGVGTTELSATGTMTISDLDDTDTVTMSETYNNDIAWSGGAITTDQLSAAQITAIIDGFVLDDTGALAIDDTTNTVDSSWTYTTSQDLNFLAAGETLTFSYEVMATDDSGVAANEDSATQTVTITLTGTNDQPVIDSITTTGGLTEVAGTGVGTTELSATGTMTISDLDDTDTVTMSETYNNDIAWSGGAITTDQLSAAQITAIIDGFVLDDTGALAIDDTTNTVDSSWTYTTSQDLNFLAAGETLTFSYEVMATDDSGVAANEDSATQTVTITLTGTNDQPVIDSITTTGGLTEVAGTGVGTTELSATGTMTISDLDDTDTVTMSETYNNDIAWSGGAITTDQLSAAQITAIIDGFVLDDTGALAIDDTTNTVDSSWTYTTSQDLNFLAAGETLTFSYEVMATDDSGVAANEDSATQTVTITLTGTNDQPVIDSITTTGGLTEVAGTGVGTTELSATGTMTISDLDDTDTVTMSETYNNDIAWSGGAITTDQLSAAQITAIIDGFVLDDTGALAIDDTTNTVDSSWTYTTSQDLNFLAAGETLTFSYEVMATDDSGVAANEDSATQTVTITLTGTNDQPVIDSITTTGGLTEVAGTGVGTTELSATGTMTISDLDDTDTVTMSETYNNDIAWSGGAITTDQLSAAQITAIIDGFVLDDTGALAIDDTTNTVDSSWTYTTSQDLNFLAAGETLTFSYEVMATDDSGVAANEDSATQTVTITLTGTNDQPVIDSITTTGGLTEVAGTGVGTTELSATGTMTISDLDDTDTVTMSETYNNDIAWSGGTITTDQLSAAQITAIIDGFVLDDTGALAIDDTTNTVDSSWTYTTSQDLNFLAAGETLTFSYEVMATDDSGVAANEDSATQTVTITLTGTNDQPEVSAVAVSQNETLGSGDTVINGSFIVNDLDSTDTTHRFEVESINFNDIESGYELTGPIQYIDADGSISVVFMQVKLPVGVDIDDISLDRVQVLNDGTFQFIGDFNALSSTDELVVKFKYTADDLNGFDGTDGINASSISDAGWVSLTVTGTNDAATVSSETKVVSETNTAITTGGTLTSTDIDNPDNTFTANTIIGTNGTFSINTAGVWTFTANSAFDSLNVGDSISETFNVTSIDGTPSTVIVQINGTNDAATVSSETKVVSETNTAITTGGTLTSTDIDNPDNTFTANTIIGTNGTFSINTAGVWTFTANSAFDSLNVGDSISETFNVTSIDGTPSTVIVQINGTNDAATVSSETKVVSETNTAITTGGTLTSTDIDNPDNTFTANTIIGTNGTFSINTAGVWTFTANSAFDSLNVGDSISETFNVTSIDGTPSTVIVQINGTNDGPVAVSDIGATNENASVTIDVLANDTDLDNGTYIYT